MCISCFALCVRLVNWREPPFGKMQRATSSICGPLFRFSAVTFHHQAPATCLWRRALQSTDIKLWSLLCCWPPSSGVWKARVHSLITRKKSIQVACNPSVRFTAVLPLRRWSTAGICTPFFPIYIPQVAKTQPWIANCKSLPLHHSLVSRDFPKIH